MKLLLAALATFVLFSTAAAQQPGSAELPATSNEPQTTARPGSPTAQPPAARTKAARKTRKSRRKPAAVDPKKVDILLYGIMERLETLSSLYENLGLRVSTDTLKKAYDLDKAVNLAAAPYFKVTGPDPERESIRNYRGLLESALRSVKILKGIKDRLKPADTESAILAAGDFYLAMHDELAGPKLIPVTIEPRPQSGKARPPAAGEDLANETETLFAISEMTITLSSYRKEEGKFPKRLKDLVSKYIPALPSISIADHPRTAEVVEIDSLEYDYDYTKAFNDTGKWLYFSDKKSRYYGRIFVDCTHKDAQGVEFYRIGEKK